MDEIKHEKDSWGERQNELMLYVNARPRREGKGLKESDRLVDCSSGVNLAAKMSELKQVSRYWGSF